MKINVAIQKCLVVICLSAVFAGLSIAEVEKQSSMNFRSLKVLPGFSKTRAAVVAEAIDFENWPKTELLRLGPVIDKALLSKPELVTRKSVSYTYTQFDQQPWGKSVWSWDSLVESDRPVPTELPPERREKLLARMLPEQRKDPVFVERYLKRKLKTYQKAQKYSLEGQMSVELALAPSSRAAQEYLLATMTDNNTLPTEDLVSRYSRAKQREKLGDISFFTESRNKDDVRIRFVRDNICLIIWSNGSLAAEALPLARKLDAIIVKQPVFTYQQLIDQRPSITIASEPDEQMKTVSYDASAPAGQKIVRLEAFVNGQSVLAKDGQIHLLQEKGRLEVKLTAVTQQLLANSFERQLVIVE